MSLPTVKLFNPKISELEGNKRIVVAKLRVIKLRWIGVIMVIIMAYMMFIINTSFNGFSSFFLAFTIVFSILFAVDGFYIGNILKNKARIINEDDYSKEEIIQISMPGLYMIPGLVIYVSYLLILFASQ